MAFSRIEPFGAEWENALFAMLASILANANTDPKKRKKAFTIENFMLLKEKSPDTPSAEALMAKFKSLTARNEE